MNIKSHPRPQNVRFQVGTSGFMTTQKQWCKMGALNCIEFNSSFYKIPSDKSIENLLSLPDNISVIIKVSKYITHIKRLKDIKDAWLRLWQQISKLRSKLKCVLFQMPPSFMQTCLNIQRIIDIKSYVSDDLNVAFEFRHISWLNKYTTELFNKLKWCIVGTYIIKQNNSKWIGTMPSGLCIYDETCNFNYIRIHGKKGWKGLITNVELQKIKERMAVQKVSTSIVMFNNTFFEHKTTERKLINDLPIKYAAVQNAVEFALIKQKRVLTKELTF